MWIFCRVEACREALTAVVVSRPRSLRSMALVGMSIPPIRYRSAAKRLGQICTFLSFLCSDYTVALGACQQKSSHPSQQSCEAATGSAHGLRGVVGFRGKANIHEEIARRSTPAAGPSFAPDA